MSSIDKKSLYSILKNFLPSFLKMLQLAKEYHVNFEIEINPNGDITLTTREYEEKDGKKIVIVNEVTQGVDFLNYRSREHFLGGKSYE